MRPISCGALAFAAVLGWSSPEAYGLISVNQPWIKPGTASAEAYMNLTSTEGAALVAVDCPLAAHAVLRAGRPGRTLPSLALPAGKLVSLRAAGKRIVLLGLARPLKLGDRVPLTLVFEAAGARQEVAVDAEVRNESPLEAELRSRRH
jgi:periplasmic copper chaperone A